MIAAGPESDGRNGDRLPMSALLALAMTGFTAILTETLPAGLLPQMARGSGSAKRQPGRW